MAKIQNIGVGNFIRNPRGRHTPESKQQSIEVLQISSNQGNSFLCYPVKDAGAVPVTVDQSRHYFIPIDTNVERVMI